MLAADEDELNEYLEMKLNKFEKKAYKKASELRPDEISGARIREISEEFFNQYLLNADVLPWDMFSEAHHTKALNYKKEVMNSLMGQFLFVPLEPIVSQELKNWLDDERKSDRYYWPLQKTFLEEKMPLSVINKIDIESDAVLSLVHDPKDKSEWQTRGLVMGSIQSGKTANYSALAAKAADAGYRIIIILSGVHNDLRFQTQHRLDEAFVGAHSVQTKRGHYEKQCCGIGSIKGYDSARMPRCGTTLAADFIGMANSPEKLPWLLVVKKNTTVFGKLKKWLEDIKNRNDWPLLVIDDEADLASINTRKNNQDLATATNAFIREILSLFPRASFVAYTATPFANVFIDAKSEIKSLGKDLFPKDFIYRLSAPKNYFGPKEFFGEETQYTDLYEVFGQEEVVSWMTSLHEERNTAPASLKRALMQFVLSTAIRLKRYELNEGKTLEEILKADYSDGPLLETSMLIHVSHLTADHSSIASSVTETVKNLRSEYLIGWENTDASNILEELLSLQREKVTPDIEALRKDIEVSSSWYVPESIAEINDEIRLVFEELQIRVVNGLVGGAPLMSPARSSAAGQQFPVVPVIYIGGNKLSRGLTLKGLCVSIFLRGTYMYDVLMQMGRWFGYRDGYLDLCRLYATTEIYDRFRNVSDALQDFEAQIDEMNSHNRTPENYRLKIRSHAGLMATAKNKMRTAMEFEPEYGGSVSYKMRFDLDQGLMLENLAAAKILVDKLNDQASFVYGYGIKDDLQIDPSGKTQQPKGRLWKDVPTELIVDFLRKYRGLKNNEELDQKGITGYISRMSDAGKLNKWTVWIPGDPSGELEGADKDIGSKALDRTKSELGAERQDYDEKSVQLSILKTGGSELMGVPKDIYEAAAEVSANSSHKFFRNLRKLAGDSSFGIADQGFFQLYSFTTERIKQKDELKYKGHSLPLFSYFLWLPTNKNEDRYMVNWTVSEDEDDMADMEDEE